MSAVAGGGRGSGSVMVMEAVTVWRTMMTTEGIQWSDNDGGRGHRAMRCAGYGDRGSAANGIGRFARGRDRRVRLLGV